MRHRGWFTLAIRAIGLYFIGTTFPMVWALMLTLIEEIAGTADQIDRMAYGMGIPNAIVFLFSIYLFFGAPRLVNWCLRRTAGICPVCGYDLYGVTADKCPECGTPFTKKPQPESSTPSSEDETAT